MKMIISIILLIATSNILANEEIDFAVDGTASNIISIIHPDEDKIAIAGSLGHFESKMREIFYVERVKFTVKIENEESLSQIKELINEQDSDKLETNIDSSKLSLKTVLHCAWSYIKRIGKGNIRGKSMNNSDAVCVVNSY